jgi:hypothetical protein
VEPAEAPGSLTARAGHSSPSRILRRLLLSEREHAPKKRGAWDVPRRHALLPQPGGFSGRAEGRDADSPPSRPSRDWLEVFGSAALRERGLQIRFRQQAAVLDGARELPVVTIVLVRVGLSEVTDRTVEPIALAEVGGDCDAVP